MSTSWNNRTPVTTTLTDRTPVTTNWGQRVNFLLKEDEFYLLLENGGRIVLSGVTAASTDWTNRTEI